jgi:aminoglycoside/choline kinase family phosphotransferase
MGYYDAEHHFYRDVATGAGIRTPRCWYTDGDAESGLYVLLIEHVGHLDIVDQSVGLDAGKAESVLRHLGALHGRNWQSSDLLGHEWLPVGYGEAIRVYGLLMNDAWPAWSDAVRGVISPADLALAELFVQQYDRLIDAWADEPWTLVHRDFRVDNMAFDGDEPVVFDWGAVARGGNLYDVAYFLGGSVETHVRRPAQAGLLRSYREALAAAGGPTYDDDHFEQVLRVNALFCLIVPIMGGGNVLDAKDHRGEELIATMLRRTFELLHDLDAAREIRA